METLTANISGKVRRDILNGRDYLVASATLIVPGVLNGSQGPLLYPPEEVQRSAEAWNGVPLMLRHPNNNGRPISARTQEALNRQGLGVVLNADFKEKLTAEMWFDLQSLERLDRSLLAVLENGEKVELSTGLRTHNKEGEGTHDGTAYRAIATDYQPDHVAVLPDQMGACSIDDGCGISNKSNLTKKESTMDPEAKKAVIDFIIANCGHCDEEDREALNTLGDDKLNAQKADLEKASVTAAVANAATKDFIDASGSKHVWNAEKKAFDMIPKVTKKEDKKVDNTLTTPALTAEQEEDLAFARQVRQERRDVSITAITANKDNKLTAEQLEKMPLDILQNMAASLPQKEQRVDYSGAAGAPVMAANAEDGFADFGLPHEYIENEE